MCEFVMENFENAQALHLRAYVIWRLNWVHPFTDGNGPTSRRLVYFILCAQIGYRLPGHETLPEQIAANKAPYYAALEDTDSHWAMASLNLSALEALLDQCLAKQLLSAYEIPALVYQRIANCTECTGGQYVAMLLFPHHPRGRQSRLGRPAC